MSKGIRKTSILSLEVDVKNVPKEYLTFSETSRIFKTSVSIDLSQYKVWGKFECAGGVFYCPIPMDDMTDTEKFNIFSIYEANRNSLNSGDDIETKKTKALKAYDKTIAKLNALGLKPTS